MRTLAIDPGTHRSAWVLFEDREPFLFGFDSNDEVVAMCDWLSIRNDPDRFTVVIEKVESFGMAVGAEVFETVRWAGRFEQAAQPAPVVRIGRKAVKMALCGSPRAKDPNIRQAVIDRFGGVAATKKGGVLHGMARDVWAAAAVGLTYLETKEEAT